jgi:hypothetical protein
MFLRRRGLALTEEQRQQIVTCQCPSMWAPTKPTARENGRGGYSVRRNATRSAFSCAVRWIAKRVS